jgi:predicted phosphoribosyltransferase
LEIPLSLIISRKIGHPENEEFAVCAATEEGELVCEEGESSKLDRRWLEDKRKMALKEIERRRIAYGSKRLPATGKVAIIVDDGIATGLTMRAAIRSLRGELPSMIVVAAPIAPAEVAEYLRSEADDVVILDTSEPFLGAIGAYYDSFPQLSDEEVIRLMDVPA